MDEFCFKVTATDPDTFAVQNVIKGILNICKIKKKRINPDLLYSTACSLILFFSLKWNTVGSHRELIIEIMLIHKTT